MNSEPSKNAERRMMYAFKRDLEKVIRLHEIDKLSNIPAPILATYFIRQFVAIEAILENLDYK